MNQELIGKKVVLTFNLNGETIWQYSGKLKAYVPKDKSEPMSKDSFVLSISEVKREHAGND